MTNNPESKGTRTEQEQGRHKLDTKTGNTTGNHIQRSDRGNEKVVSIYGVMRWAAAGDGSDELIVDDR